MSVVEIVRRGRIALILVDNPPVNAISAAVRKELVAALREAEADEAVAAMVLSAKGRTFMAGADIREFGLPPEPPALPEVVAMLEAATKPLVAAIHGTALGGGLELALGCHYRVAHRAARVGLPEVTLGLIPGAQGTQRLPRLAGAAKALEMIVTGRPIPAAQAKMAGIVDELAEGDLLEAATAYAESLVESGAGPRRLSEASVPPEGASPEDFAAFRERMAKRLRGLFAPERAIRAVEAAVHLPFAKGVERERALFLECLAHPQSAALRHAFFAERKAARVPGITKDAPRRPVEAVGIVGGGTMGSGIALAFLAGGMAVTLVERDEGAAESARKRIEDTLEKGIALGKVSGEARDEQLARLTLATDVAALADLDLAIEAVFERMDVKCEVFGKLDAVARPGAILATNTSYLDVDAIASATSRPEDVLGLHFFSPANIMKLLEVVRASRTSDEVLATALDLARRIGKTPVVAGVCRGFIGNRMLQGYAREAGLLLLEGAPVEAIDRVMVDFGFAMGPLAVSDLAGLDIGWMLRRQSPPESFDETAFRVHDRLVEMGRKGRKSGAGFYDYEDSRAGPSDEVRALIEEEAEKAGIRRRKVDAEEIVERCVLPLIDEGARILEEGIALRASDIDVVYLLGYGFPRWRGGPMFYADSLGLAHVLERIEHYRGRLGDRWWTPAPLLKSLACEGGSFAAWDEGRSA